MNTSLFLLFRKNMAEVGIAEYFNMAEALGIIAPMVVVLYFSRKQMQALSVDIEPRSLTIWMKEYTSLQKWELKDLN
jgi:hypothetical protein